MDHAPIDAPPRDYQPDLLPDEPPKWPGAVGVISIVWAALGIVCGGCGVLSPVIMKTFLAQAEQQFGPMPDVMKPGALQVVLAGVSLAWAFLLLAAGIMLALRKPAARPLHLLYAVGSVILTVISTILGVMAQLALREWVQNNPDNQWAQQAAQQPPIAAYATIAFSVVLGLAWPVFCLIWFGAVKRSARDITGGAPA